MVIAVLGVEPIKDPSVDDWEGGCVFLEGNGASLASPCGLRAHLGVGGHECQMARPHLICKDAAPECRCAIMNRAGKNG